MKRIILVAAMVAMLVLSAAPAYATDLDFDGIADEVEINFSVSGFNPVASTNCFIWSWWWGKYVNICPAVVWQVDNEQDVFQAVFF